MKSNSKKKKNLGQKGNSKDKRVSAKNGNFVKEVKGQDKSKKQGLKTSGLYLKYISEVVPEMMKKFKYKSPMAVPKLEKIVVNTGIGPWLDKGKEIKEDIKKDLGIICGQKPAPTRARKAIAGFKIKIGQEIGAKVVLRKIKMYDFLERLIVEALPRVKDFRGIPESNFGERGEVSFGIKEHVAFAEINSEEVNNVFSLEVSIVNSGNTKKEGLELMKLLGFPISFESEMKEMNNNKLQVEKHKKAVAMKNDK